MSAWSRQGKGNLFMFNLLPNPVTITVWLWQVHLLPWLSFPDSRADTSFISTASCCACSWVLSPANSMLTTALLFSNIYFFPPISASTGYRKVLMV